MSKAVDAINRADAALSPLEQRATWLGYAGLAPFLFTSICIWISPALFPSNYAYAMMQWQLTYGAIVLSFLGGIRWGLALMNDQKITDYITINQITNSVVPPIIGWLMVIPAHLIPGVAPSYLARHLVMLLAFLLIMQADRYASDSGFAPAWYGAMRLKITMFLSLIVLLSMMRMVTLGW